MKIAVLNVSFQLKPTLEPLGTEQAICVFEEAGFETLFYASSLHGTFDDEFAERVMACDGVMFTGISNVRDILDQFYERRDDIASMLRAKGYEGFIVATGHQVSLKPEETLAACSAIDAVIVSDPDVAACEMVQRLQKGTPLKGVVRPEFVSGAAQPQPASAWQQHGYVDIATKRPYLEALVATHDPHLLAAVIETSRGCSHGRCTFCSTAALVQAGLKAHCALKPVEAIVQEMEFIYRTYGVSRFIMEDDFAAPPTPAGARRLEELAQRVESLPFRIEFSIVIRPDAITDETRPIFEDLRDSGLVLLYLGIESFNETDLQLYGKNIAFDKMLHGIDIAQDLGYKMDISSRYRIKPGLMPFHPYTTLEGIKEQSPYLATYAITPVKMIAEVELYPGTPLYAQAEEDGLLAPGTRSGFHYKRPEVELFNASMRDNLRAMNKPRKRIRNMEKTVQGFGLDSALIADIRAYRKQMESLFADAYESLLELCLLRPAEAAVRERAAAHRDLIAACAESGEVVQAIDDAWRGIANALRAYYPDVTPETDVSFSRPCWFPVIH